MVEGSIEKGWTIKQRSLYKYVEIYIYTDKEEMYTILEMYIYIYNCI